MPRLIVKKKYEEELTDLRTSSESTIEKLRERLDEVEKNDDDDDVCSDDNSDDNDWDDDNDGYDDDDGDDGDEDGCLH